LRDNIKLLVSKRIDQLIADVQRAAKIEYGEDAWKFFDNPNWQETKNRLVDWLDLYVEHEKKK